jgi:hypothetical protein
VSEEERTESMLPHITYLKKCLDAWAEHAAFQKLTLRAKNKGTMALIKSLTLCFLK